jgi:aldose 1-epimerase
VTTYPTGEQYEISYQTHRAVITEVGATLRSFSVDDRDVVRGFGADEVVHGGHGQQLLPWPNRIRDGRYTFESTQQQLALTEPDRHNAIHGLVRHVAWTLLDHRDDSVSQRVRVYPQLGWPGTLEATLTHTISAGGLEVKVTATNIGSGPLPFGYAAHPYFTVGEARVDDIVLEVPAASFLEVDDRLLPVKLRPVDGSVNDFREAHPVGSVTMDTAFTGLRRGADGLSRVRMSLGDRYAELWADRSMGWFQVFTGDDRRDVSLAVEPMTCGPDAFNPGPTEADRIVLLPGDTFSGRWGIAGR